MAKGETDRSICTSIFKEGNSTTKSQFTAKWIELINRLEKDKTRLAFASGEKR